MPRLVVVSNRVAIPDPEGPRQAGGLAVAVQAALKHREGLWFGWSGEISDKGANNKPKVVERRQRSFVTIDLSPTDHQEYYNGFANRVLWPILHYRVDLAEFTAVDLSGYLRVNAGFADALSGFIRPDDWIWVHDYHLLPLARELRTRGHDNPIGFFLHIPCPPPDILMALPQHAETLGTLGHYDLVGTQTEHDAENLRHYFEQQGVSFNRNRTAFDIDGRRVQLRAFPVAIATRVYARTARSAIRSDFANEVRDSLAGRRLILGVDRLDYSKGITHRIQGFSRFLEAYPEWRQHVTFLQVTPKSRIEVPEYADINQTVNTLIGEVNGRFGVPAWTPIRYVNRAYSRASLAALYRMAAVGLVTPLRDGMNLVAKEYVAAQNPENPGVLVLSQFAGAAEELDGALLVNPHEPEAMAAAIDGALRMPLAERQARHRRMYRHLAANDIDRWAERFLAALAESRQPATLFDNIRQLFQVRVGK
ncbi:MAG TPA: trehalose-6-phosphate synthase [Stellaceae bacterium]|nr:trehalose-6-phosphate synthase [Stellaceae bacterium]